MATDSYVDSYGRIRSTDDRRAPGDPPDPEPPRRPTVPPVNMRAIAELLADQPAQRIALDPYLATTASWARDRFRSALDYSDAGTEAEHRLTMMRALTDVTSTTSPGGLAGADGPLSPAARSIAGRAMLDPRAAAPFLNAVAVRCDPFGAFEAPLPPTVTPGRLGAEKTAIPSGGQLSPSAAQATPVAVGLGLDVSLVIVERSTPAYLELLFAEVGAAVYGKADAEALADVLATPGLATAATLPDAVGAAVAAQPSDRPPVVVLSTGQLDLLDSLRLYVDAGLVRAALSSALPIATAAVVVGGRAVAAMASDLTLMRGADVGRLGWDLAWFLTYALAVRAPSAIVTVPAV